MRSNRIGKIRKENEGWAEEEGEKKNLITNYFLSFSNLLVTKIHIGY
jgi:hypothetical protein